MNRTEVAPMKDALRSAVELAVMLRRSIRAGVNTQPWRVHVITGQAEENRLVFERVNVGSFTTFYAD